MVPRLFMLTSSHTPRVWSRKSLVITHAFRVSRRVHSMFDPFQLVDNFQPAIPMATGIAEGNSGCMTKPRLGSKPGCWQNFSYSVSLTRGGSVKLSQMLILTSRDFSNSFQNAKVPYTRHLVNCRVFCENR